MAMSEGPRGERGPTGDHGQNGTTGLTGLTGPMGIAGSDAPAPARGPLWMFAGAALLASLAFLLLGVLLYNLSSGFDDERAEAAAERAQLQERIIQLNDILATEVDKRVDEQAAEDCFDLYQNDVSNGLAANIGGITHLVIALSSPEATNERAVNEAVADLQEADVAYRAAIKARNDYDAIQPPPAECPYPTAQD